MTEQSAVTLVADVIPGREQALAQVLAELGRDPARNEVVPFGALHDVHYARLVTVEPTVLPNGRPVLGKLVYMADVDGPADRHLVRLVSLAGARLDRVFGHCVDYPVGRRATQPGRLAFLRARQVPAAATYVNTTGRTVHEIRREARLRDAIEEFLDRGGDWSRARPAEVREAIRRFVAGDRSLSWATAPRKSPGVVARVRAALDLVPLPLALLAVFPLVLLVLPFYLALLRRAELTDAAPIVRPDPRRVDALAALEDRVAQNQFTAIGYLKPGLLRQVTARTILYLANWGVRHIFNHADLTGVKTIHFARWVFLDGGRRLIFGSNYDGSLEAYMDDFIDKVSWGLNAVFSNGVGYPRTNWLVLDGAKDELAFKYFIRNHQLPTQVWYAAYDDVTALNAENNARIRDGLAGDLDEAATTAWLRRL
ncbi:MAG TPA: hypothetical protein VFC93_12480 [Chloroflexota bacterium]|nr:hypothetical protein [Chloroflexota bacterium]